jgi:hypothetical protein
MKLIATLALAVVLIGCTKTPIQRHPATATDPGSTTQIDADAYDALLVADDAIKTTKADLANNIYPAATVVNVKAVLNHVISLYDPMDNAYIAYHKDQTNTGLANALTPQIQPLKDAITQLIAAKKGQ